MAKSKGFTEEDLKRMGLSEVEKGVFAPTAKNNVGKDYHDVELVVKGKVNNSPDFVAAPVTEWFIPYQTPSKKNSQQLYIKRYGTKMVPATTTSKRYKDYINVTKMYWTTFGKEFRKTIETLGLKYPLKVEFTFIRSTKQKVDYVGPLESCQDIMQDFNWIDNDDAYTLKPSLGDLQVDKNRAGVIIKILI